MKRFLATLAGILAAGAAALGLAASAHADPFGICGIGYGAEPGTSCAFAYDVAQAYLATHSTLFSAYSPVTGMTYRMQCGSGFTVNVPGQMPQPALRCSGGDGAVVWIW